MQRIPSDITGVVSATLDPTTAYLFAQTCRRWRKHMSMPLSKISVSANPILMDWFLERGLDPQYVYRHAILAGLVGVSKWLKARFPNLSREPENIANSGCLSLLESTKIDDCRPYICAYAGSLTTLKWLRRHDYPWDMQTCELAAGKSLDVLLWARVHDCIWDVYTIAEAICSGHVATLQS